MALAATTVALHLQSGAFLAQTFRTESTLVPIDAVVTDRAGNPVLDLTKDDFIVEDEGRTQPITTFARVTLPVEPTVPPPGCESGLEANLGACGGRVYLLVLDDLTTVAIDSEVVKRAARQFVDDHLRPNDVALVAYTSSVSLTPDGFTREVATLRGVIDTFLGQRLPGTLAPRTLEGRSQTPPPGAAMERLAYARRSLDTLAALVEWAGAMPSQISTTVLFFSQELIPGASRETCGRAGLNGWTVCGVTTAAAKANIRISTIDPRGLLPPAASAGSATGTVRLPIGVSQEAASLQTGMRALAEETGGTAVVNTNAFSAGFERIVRDASTYYVLGFEPSRQAPGELRRIRVRVKREGVEVRARQGYIVSSAAPADRSSPEPVSEDARAGGSTSETESVVLRARTYVTALLPRLSGVVARESYYQVRDALPRLVRRLESDFLMVRLPDGDEWAEFRNVLSVDDRSTPLRARRLEEIFAAPTPDRADQLRELAFESTRYVLGAGSRPILTTPLTALALLQDRYATRFRFTDGGRPRRGEPGGAVVVASEVGRPTVFRDRGGRDLVARARFWVDRETGQVLRSELAVGPDRVTADFTIDDGLGIAVPSRMQTDHLFGAVSTRVRGTATYGQFRQFEVRVDETFR